MDYIKELDNILMTEDIAKNFHKKYKNVEFKKWLDSLLPEIEKCANLKQDNPWHIYNCLDHILHSVEHMNLQTYNLSAKEQRMLSYTMFLHDIGKPECFIRRYSKLYGREVDSFFNHNIAGERIADRVLPKLNFDKDDIKIMKKLIHDHDMFMFITLENDGNPYHNTLTHKLIEDKINELNDFGDGKQLLKYLIMIGGADNLAQNSEMTGDSLRVINKMDDMLENDLTNNM